MHVLRRLGLLGLFLAVVAFASGARAESGDGVGVGPVIGITWHDSVSLGWELAGARGPGPFARFSVGGSYHLSAHADDPAYFHYVAWEPWAYIGGTLGASLTDQRDVRVVYGLWEGLGKSVHGTIYDDDTLHWAVSLSIGWRGIGSTHQFYLTPKLWRIQGWDFFT